MHVVVAIILVSWIAFWIYWFASAVGVKPGRTRWAQFAVVRIVVFVLIVVLVRANVFKGQTITDDHWRQTIGLVAYFAGLALAVWARRAIGRNWGTPMTEKVDAELVRSGPYRRIRHPIYSGIVLAMIGTAIALSWYWVIVAAAFAAYFAYSAFMEERYMTNRLPEAYADYKRGTKMFVPYLL